MKKASLIFLFLTIIIAYQNVIFASYNSQALEAELYLELEEIFKYRTKIWNQFLRGEYLSAYELEQELKKIITDPLLKSDIEMFEEMLLNPTSYESIGKVSIEDLDIIKITPKKSIVEALVFWEIEGYEYRYHEEIKYLVELEKVEEQWLLSSYEIIQ